MPGPNSTAYTIKFNAPALISADTSRHPGLDYANNTERLEGPKGEAIGLKLVDIPRSDVISRKGFFIPDTSFSSDWQDTADDENLQSDGNGTQEYASLPSDIGSLNLAGIVMNPLGAWESVKRLATGDYVSATDPSPSSTPDKLTINTLFPNNQKFGFRFMYNPPSLSFSVGVFQNVNSSYILTNPDSALPISSSGSTISVEIDISRVDDMSIAMWAAEQAATDSQLLNKLYGSGAANLPSSLPDSSRVSTGVTLEDLNEIRTKGTMYDLDFLFRTTLGRQWETVYRGTTADIGIMFSQPLMLYLSKAMVYRVRLTGVNYTHMIFTPDMIPTYTKVSLSFQRIPDGKRTEAGVDTVQRDKNGRTAEEAYRYAVDNPLAVSEGFSLDFSGGLGTG